MRRLHPGSLVLHGALAMACVLAAGSAGAYQIGRHAIASGGTSISFSPNYRGGQTSAQTATGTATSPNYRVLAGFWQQSPQPLAPYVVDGTWHLLAQPSLSGLSMIFDPVRDRLVVFGGTGGNVRGDVWQTRLGGGELWTELRPLTPGPGRRTDHSAVYDPVRDRMLVFGGYDQTNERNDVWAFSLATTAAWSQLTPAGTPPSGRTRQSMIYDPVRDRLVIFGGFPYNNEVWALSLAGTPTWSQLAPSGTPPSARYGSTAIYDPIRDRMLLFAGGSGIAQNDTWALSLGATPAWTPLTPSGTLPVARALHSAIYDPIRDRMLIFAGSDNTGSVLNDVWALALAATPAWTHVLPSGGPPAARSGHDAIYDPRRDQMMVFAGAPNGTFQSWSDLWGLTLAGTPAWTTYPAPTNPPPARHQHIAVHDDTRNRLIIFGGTSETGTYLNDTWTLALTGPPAYASLAPSGTPPSARGRHVAIYDHARDRVIVYGGRNGSGFLSDAWALNLSPAPAWVPLTPAGSASPRAGHTAAHDPTRDVMIVFGGENATGKTDEVRLLALAGGTAWSVPAVAGTRPSARMDHAAVRVPSLDAMLVFGGQDNSAQKNDTWRFNVASNTWTQLTPTGTIPFPRSDHTAVFDSNHNRMLVHGGDVSGTTYGDARAYDILANAWTWLNPAGWEPLFREGHAGVFDDAGDRMVFNGGTSAFGTWNEAGSLNFSTPTDVEVSMLTVGEADVAPGVALLANAPNPFNPRTTIRYQAPRDGASISLEIYDVGGRIVRTLVHGPVTAGTHEVTWDGRDERGAAMPSGVYFSRLAAAGFSETRKLVLAK